MIEAPEQVAVTDGARLHERRPPDGPAVMYQRWEELLFLHWACEPGAIQATLPPGLTVDTCEGRAWVGVVPFFMRRVRPRFLPAAPGISDFLELNLRTYVVDRTGRPGVWFYSLDTSHRIPAWIARTLFHLNYRWAAMEASRDNGRVRYQSARCLPAGRDPAQHFEWSREGQAFHPRPGSLEFFLVERYRLFSWDAKRSRLFTGRVHHRPYPVERARCARCSTRLFTLNGLGEPEGEPDSVLASAGVDVTVYPLRCVPAAS